jgi:hypothetical protein
MKNNNIICDYVKVTGSSHITKNIPCQDFSISEIYRDHVILINCDGAGSAKKAEIGSQSFAELFLIELKKIADNLKNIAPGEWIIDEIIISISNVRKQIRNKFKTNSLFDYHTTLVAIISGENGGFICHIGDGYGLALTDKDFFISGPENGEYANETFFATESNWIKHLRITPFGGTIKFLGVMSDGAGSLFEASGKFNQVNLCEFINSLIKVKSHKDVLTDFLSNDLAVKKSNDDKSISFYINTTSDFSSLFKINKIENINCNSPSNITEIEEHNKDEVVIKKKSTYASYFINTIFIIILSIAFIKIDNYLELNILKIILNSIDSIPDKQPLADKALSEDRSNPVQNECIKLDPANCTNQNDGNSNGNCEDIKNLEAQNPIQNKNSEDLEHPQAARPNRTRASQPDNK